MNTIMYIERNKCNYTLHECIIIINILLTNFIIWMLFLNLIFTFIKYLLFHSCPKTTDASRLALEDYMTNNSNQKVKHLTWTVY